MPGSAAVWVLCHLLGKLHLKVLAVSCFGYLDCPGLGPTLYSSPRKTAVVLPEIQLFSSYLHVPLDCVNQIQNLVCKINQIDKPLAKAIRKESGKTESTISGVRELTLILWFVFLFVCLFSDWSHPSGCEVVSYGFDLHLPGGQRVPPCPAPLPIFKLGHLFVDELQEFFVHSEY